MCVRADGLSAILEPLLDDRRIVAATLVDVGSGLVLDAVTRDEDLTDLELLGAGHADVARAAGALTGRPSAGPSSPGEVPVLTVDAGDGRVHLLRPVPDPHGDRLVLAVVVRGGARHVVRARRRLEDVPAEALTAGPSAARRPVDGRWSVEPVVPAVAAVPPEGLPGLDGPAPRPDGGWAAASPAPAAAATEGDAGPAPPPAMLPTRPALGPWTT